MHGVLALRCGCMRRSANAMWRLFASERIGLNATRQPGPWVLSGSLDSLLLHVILLVVVNCNEELFDESLPSSTAAEVKDILRGPQHLSRFVLVMNV